MNTASQPDHQAFLDHWFGPLAKRNEPDTERMRFWFAATAEQDAAVKQRWSSLLQQAAAGELTHWCNEPRQRLALIVVLDQLPRILYRGTAEAFAYDGMALALSLSGIAVHHDTDLMLHERAFFYMPLQHSEDIMTQQLSLRQYQTLITDFPEHHALAKNYSSFAQDHADIIQQFSRYPHRNKILNRKNTPNEEHWLASGDAKSFGQG